MTSREAEDVHLTLLNKLLADSGVECIRPQAESTESIVSEGEGEETGAEEEHPAPQEEKTEEEERSVLSDETPEELPAVFPTPSLRRVIPEKIRQIEEQNRIYVLPEEFNTDIDPQDIPKIAHTPQQTYIEIIADLVGCKQYRSSLAEFWFLDTMANLLRRAQEDELDRPTQAILMLWFCEWMKEIQYFDAADRQRMLARFKDNMLAAAKYISATEQLPTPAAAGVFYKADDERNDGTRFSPTATSDKHLVTFEGTGYGCSLTDLTKIIHYIFDLFSTDYQYDLVRSIFTHTPEYTLIDAPYQIQNPKKMYVQVKGKPKKEVKKVDKPTSAKGKKKSVIDLEAYLHLMQIKLREEKYLDEQEEIEREAWNRKSHILPLSLSTSADDDFFNKYWPPPPPPPEPEPKPEAEPKNKPKKGGKGKN